ncbi:MAG: Ger(x)C family spore germination protein [Paenibacillaceae bacterium]|nr:Ger(x)C family spore germination protein [Paenibacillaceae bacterium]
MVKTMLAACLLIAAAFATTGCWSSFELIERGFVQAAAIDLTEDGNVRLISHVYKPGGGTTSLKSDIGPSYVDLTTTGSTVFDAVRKVPLQLGRKLQWSHMRILLIGEEVARSENIGNVLDFFYRDHEPRGTIDVILTKGQAGDYLTLRPMIESTMGQQLLRVEEIGTLESGRTINVTVTKLKIRSSAEVPTEMLPLLAFKNGGKNVVVSGLATVDLAKGKLTGTIPLANVQSALMLSGKFKRGIIDVPCGKERKPANSGFDSFEVGSAKAKLTPVVAGDALRVGFRLELEGSAGELVCSKADTKEEVRQFAKRVEQTVERQIRDTVMLLQSERSDAIGVGTKVYRQHSRVWKRWKPDWERRFAECEFDISVKAIVKSTGTTIGKPFSESK